MPLKEKKKITQSKPTHKSNLLKNKPSKKKKIIKFKISKKKTSPALHKIIKQKPWHGGKER
jgi:hypothetical protein